MGICAGNNFIFLSNEMSNVCPNFFFVKHAVWIDKSNFQQKTNDLKTKSRLLT